MTKHVSIHEESNQVKEFPDVSPEDKVNFWVSKEDIARFRKEVEAEDLLSSARDMVAETVMGVTNKTEEDEETKQQVESVMSGGIEHVLQFLAQNGVKLITPPGMSPQESAQSLNAEEQVRNMLRKKLMAEQPSGVSEELLARQIHQIMQLPRNKILEFLRKPSATPPSPPPSPPPRFNWFKDCTDSWAGIPPQIKQAIQVLGYNEDLWNNGEQPEESNEAFQDLSELQQKAVVYLGSTPEQWDGDEAPPPPLAEEPSQDEIMMQKIQELVKTKLLSEQTFSSDETLQGVIREIMSLPKEKIKEYLQMPPAPKTPQAMPAIVEESLPFEAPSPEASMVEKIRELVKFKLQRELNILDSSELLEGAIHEIMSLPHEKIKEYLQKPLLPKNLKPKRFNWVWDSKASWVELPSEVREAAEDLGFVEESWNQTEQPEESDRIWDELSPRQQGAATKLGYSKGEWDGVANDPTSSAEGEDEDEFTSNSSADGGPEKVVDVDEEEFLSNFMTESMPKGGLQHMYVPTDDETEFSDDETEHRTLESSSPSSSKQDTYSHQLETFVTLWAFNPQALNT
jgi:histidinol phosphatase-like enzyme